MLVITPQVAAFVAALSISGVNAAALPRAQAGAQVRLAVHVPNNIARSVPTAKLPATVMAKMEASSDKHVPGNHHRDQKSGKGKKKNHKRRLALQARDNSVHAEALSNNSNKYEDHDDNKSEVLGKRDVSSFRIKSVAGSDIFSQHDHHHHHHHHHHGRDSEHKHVHIHSVSLDLYRR